MSYTSFMLAKRLHENKIKRFFLAPLRPLVKAISPVAYVKAEYHYITHHRLNLKNPVRYTEKLQWLRLYGYPKDPRVIRCADRATVRDYVEELGLKDILIPVYGVYDRFEDIDFATLPKSFVIKCTHASGYNVIVLDKDKLDLQTTKQKFHKWLTTDYGRKTVEPHYSKIKPQIIIEEYIGGKTLPTEYKIHVFNGVAKSLYVVTGRGSDIRYNNYYIDWTPFDGSQFNGWLKTEKPLEKPLNFEDMVKIAESLAAPFPFVRVDLYDIDGRIYFSEMTFTPAKGTLIFDDDRADFEMGKWLTLPTSRKSR